MPLVFEGFAESNPIENVDGDRFFVSKYALKILGFILLLFSIILIKDGLDFIGLI